MREGQEGTFDPLVREAREAADKVVGHSYIPDMVRDVERYLRSMKDDQRTAFDPLTAEARQAAQDVEVSMRRVREAQLQATKDRWAGVKGTGQSMAEHRPKDDDGGWRGDRGRCAGGPSVFGVRRAVGPGIDQYGTDR